MNKKVVVVGSAPTLLLKELGSKIDEFDIVIRINNYVIEGYEKHVGTKTNIFARGQSPDFLCNRDAKDYDEIWIKKGVQKWKNRFNYIPMKNFDKGNVEELKVKQVKLDRAVKFINKNGNPDSRIVVNETTGLSTIRKAIDKFYSEGNPIHIVGFNCWNIDRETKKEDVSKRFSYYRKEIVTIYDNKVKNIFKINHGFYDEKLIIRKLIEEKYLVPLIPEEINDKVDLSHLKPSIPFIPEHFKEMKKHGFVYREL